MKIFLLVFLILFISVGSLLAQKKELSDTKFLSWDSAANFGFAFLTTFIPPIFTIGTGEGSISSMYISPLINYGKEFYDWSEYGKFNWKDTGVRTAGMLLPMIFWWGVSGVTVGSYDINGQTGKIVVGWNFDLPGPSKPFKIRNFAQNNNYKQRN
jgi:hypothetical protein